MSGTLLGFTSSDVDFPSEAAIDHSCAFDLLCKEIVIIISAHQ